MWAMRVCSCGRARERLSSERQQENVCLWVLNLLSLGFPRCRNRHFNFFFCTSQPSSERCHRAVLISLVEFQIPLVHSSALTRRFQDSRFHLSALVRRFKGLQKCSKMIPYLGYLRSICLISVVQLICFFIGFY